MKLIYLIVLLLAACSESYKEIRAREQLRYEEQAAFWPYYCEQEPCNYIIKETK
jgi:hypothetical protein